MSKPCIDVGFHWAPEEAAAILDYLDRLRDQIWYYYAEDIIALRQMEIPPASIEENQQDLDF